MNRYIQEANQQFISAYNRYPIILDHGEGMYLYDIDGKRYLDFGSGIGVCGLGYHDPNYTRMLQGQIEKLLHTSNLFYNVPAIEAAKQFNQAANMEQVFFTNSGAEAIEGAIKIAKKYHFLKYKNKNGEIIAMKKSFHEKMEGVSSPQLDECLERANQERGENARPGLAENVEELENYDIVFLGYPNWWYGVPMALLSFLDHNDLSGKQVYLFCSHGTGGLANSVEIITEAVPDAEISDNIFDCYEEEAAGSEEAIIEWVNELGY